MKNEELEYQLLLMEFDEIEKNREIRSKKMEAHFKNGELSFSWDIPEERQESLAIKFLCEDYNINPDKAREMVDKFDWWDDILDWYDDSIIGYCEEWCYDEAYADKFGRC